MRRPGGGDRVVKRTLADGTVKEYRYGPRAAPAPRYGPESLHALVCAYQQSPEWHGLKDATHKNYLIYLRDLDGLAPLSATSIRRRDLLAIRGAIAVNRGNGAANVFMKTAATLFKWARDNDWLENSPADRVKALPGGHLLAWTDEEAARAIAELPAPLARVVILALYTGQRRSDLIGMTWRAYDGARIAVKQEKTGAELKIPVHPILKQALDEWKRSATSTHILTSERGTPWKGDHLTHAMHDGLGNMKPPMRPKLNVHGLRKLAAASLAEAGCSTHEIAAVTGHQSLAMVQLYTRSAAQERLAEAAISRLQNAADKRLQNDE